MHCLVAKKTATNSFQSASQKTHPNKNFYYLGSLVNLCVTIACLQSHSPQAYSIPSSLKNCSSAVWIDPIGLE